MGVNRWMEPAEGDYMNVKINMHKQPDQDGHCGNFNGVPTDDDRIQVRARVGKTGVEPAQMLFIQRHQSWWRTGQTSMIAQQRSWTMPNLCARRRSSVRQAASGPSHPWTVSLMYVLQAKALLRRVRNCTA